MIDSLLGRGSTFRIYLPCIEHNNNLKSKPADCLKASPAPDIKNQDKCMNFKETLNNGCFCLELKNNTKEGIIEEMIDLMVDAGKIKDRAAALNAVLEREKRMSTGMQYGVAIPHGKTNTVDGLVTAFALKKQGVDFASVDGQMSKIFVMTVSPINKTGPHIQYLSEISKLLQSPVIRKRLLEASTVEEIKGILSDDRH